MSTSHRARTNPERDQVVEVIDAYRASPSPDASFVALDDALFASKRAAYLAARRSMQKCAGAKTNANAAAAAADEAFDRDLRFFASSVRDSSGRAAPRVVSALLGGVLPSKLITLSRREEVQRTTDMLASLPERADLIYDANHAAALATSTDALNSAQLAYEEADLAWLTACDALGTARVGFDKAYAKLLKAGESMLEPGTFTSIFPRFVRRNPKTDDAEPVAP